MTICFTNPGEIDPRTITTLGVNVKDSASPIGYFGTGLKYAIAVLTREQQEVQVYSGKTLYTFKSIEQTIRGKSFGIVAMARDLGGFAPLGFTTELGKNWTVENAYRELHSNCLDEAGEGAEEREPTAAPGRTTIAVRGGKFAKAHRERFTFLLDPKRTKICSNRQVEIYAGASSFVFYRGIAAMKTHKPCAFLYNITQGMELTEDRTFAGDYFVNLYIGHAFATSAPQSVLETVLTAKDSFEERADYFSADPSEVFLDTCEKIIKERPLDLLENARRLYAARRKHKVIRTQLTLTAAQRAALAEAMAFCRAIGYAVDDYPVLLSPDLGERTVACTEDGKVWLSPRAFSTGALVTTLMEEYFHLRNGVDDLTRTFQDLLLAEIERLGREVVALRERAA